MSYNDVFIRCESFSFILNNKYIFKSYLSYTVGLHGKFHPMLSTQINFNSYPLDLVYANYAIFLPAILGYNYLPAHIYVILIALKTLSHTESPR